MIKHNKKKYKDPYEVEIDTATFDAIICDCYRHVHSPLTKRCDENGDWKQVPYHYGEDWETNNSDLTTNEILSKIEKRIDSIYPENPIDTQYKTGYYNAIVKVKEILKS